MKKFSAFFLIGVWVVVSLVGVTQVARAQEATTGTAPASLSTITAKDLGIEDPGMLPTSPLYFLKDFRRSVRLFFTFNPVRKAELELTYTNEKAAEAKKVEEEMPQNAAAIAKAIGNYNEAQARLTTRLKNLKDTSTNPNVDRLVRMVAEKTVLHQKLFDEIAANFKDNPAIGEKAAAARETITGAAVVALEKDSPEKAAAKVEEVLSTAKGGELKNIQSLEIIDRLATQAPENLKQRLEVLRQSFSEKFAADAKDFLAKNSPQALGEAVKNLPGDTARLSVLLDSVRAQADKRVSDALGEANKVIEGALTRSGEIAARAEEQIKIAEGAVAKVKAIIGAGAPAVSQNLVSEAEKNLNGAKDVFGAGKFGEAFGLARSAEVLARNAAFTVSQGFSERPIPPQPAPSAETPAIRSYLQDCEAVLEKMRTELDNMLKNGAISQDDYNKKYGVAKEQYSNCEMMMRTAPPVKEQTTPPPLPAIDKLSPAYYCIQEYAPVCGADGKTYPNDCYAKRAGIGVWKKGACEETNTASRSSLNGPLPEAKEIALRLEADDYGFYPNPTLTVPKGSRVKLTFYVRTSNVYYGGLDFRSSRFKTEPTRPGSTVTVEFTADQDFEFQSFWPLSGVLKSTGKVVVQ